MLSGRADYLGGDLYAPRDDIVQPRPFESGLHKSGFDFVAAAICWVSRVFNSCGIHLFSFVLGFGTPVLSQCKSLEILDGYISLGEATLIRKTGLVSEE